MTFTNDYKSVIWQISKCNRACEKWPLRARLKSGVWREDLGHQVRLQLKRKVVSDAELFITTFW